MKQGYRRLRRALRQLETRLRRAVGRPSAPARKSPDPARRQSGPGQPAAARTPAGFTEDRFSCAQGALDYRLYVPAGAAGRRLPLLVVLHGCTQTAADIAAGTGMNRLADAEGFIVLYPQQSVSANLGRCWNWHRPGNRKRGGGEAAVVAALTRHVAATCGADRGRVWIAGISAGGSAAAVAASAYPELYAALGVHSAIAPAGIRSIAGVVAAMRGGPATAEPEREAGAPPPTIIFQGDEDRVVHPANAGGFLTTMERAHGPLARHVEHGRAAGGRDYIRTAYRNPEGAVVLEHWSVHGGGHAWSGGSPDGSHTDPAGPDASREMLRFFLAHGRRAASPRPRSADSEALRPAAG